MCVAADSNGLTVYLSEITDEARWDFARRMTQVIERKDGSFSLTDQFAGITQEFTNRGPAAQALMLLQKTLHDTFCWLQDDEPMTAEVFAAKVRQAALLPIADLYAGINTCTRVMAANPEQYVTRDRIAPWEVLRAAYRKQLHIANGGTICSICHGVEDALMGCVRCAMLDAHEAEVHSRLP